MGRNYKDCFQLLLSNDIDQTTVNATIELLKEFLNNSTSNYNAESMLYIMSIISYFEEIKITTKLLELYMNEVKLKIRRILTESLLANSEEIAACVCEKNVDETVTKEATIEQPKNDICCVADDDNIYENFEGFIIKKRYIPGSSLTDTFKLPLEGQTANLKVKDELLDPDYIYFSEVEIDWQGNVLNYITAPKKIAKNLEMQEVNFDEIYHELLNEIHEYKERPVV